MISPENPSQDQPSQEIQTSAEAQAPLEGAPVEGAPVEGAPVEGAPVEGEVLSPDKEAIVRAVVTRITRMESHSGPLPHPETLRGYAEIIPNGAERVMRMAEKQQDHSHRVENTREKTALIGVLAAMFGTVCSFGTAGYALFLGFPTAAGVIATGTVAALAGAFIYGTKTQHSEQMEVLKKLSPPNNESVDDENNAASTP